MDFKWLPHTIHWIGNLWPSSLIHSCQCWISSLSLNFQWWYLTLNLITVITTWGELDDVALNRYRSQCQMSLWLSPRCHVEPDIFFTGPQQKQKFDISSNEYITKIPCWTRYLFQQHRAGKGEKFNVPFGEQKHKKFSYHAHQTIDTTTQIAGPPPCHELTSQNDAK